MINFTCNNCGHAIKVSEKHAGKKGKCPNCGKPAVVPSLTSDADALSTIKFRCPNCRQKIGLKTEYAGKQVRCAKCQISLTVPNVGQSTSNKPPKQVDTTAQQESEANDPLVSEEQSENLNPFQELLMAEQSAPEVDSQPQVTMSSEMDDELRLSPIESEQQSESLSSTLFPQASSTERPKHNSALIGYILAAINAGLSLTIAVIVLFSINNSQKHFHELADISGTESAPSQAIAERFFDSLNREQYAQAKDLFSDDSREFVETDKLIHFAKQMGNLQNLNFGTAAIREWNERELIFFACFIGRNISNKKTITFLITKDNGVRRLDTASICNFHDTIRSIGDYDNAPKHGSISVGTYTQSEIDMMNRKALSRVENHLQAFNPRVLSLNLPLGRTIFSISIPAIIILQVCMWIIFANAGRPGWASIIPFYNMWVMAQIADLSGWIGLAVIFIPVFIPIPIISFILIQLIMVIIWRGIANAFGKSVLFAIGLWLLPFIFAPLLAFTSD